ncbi:HNH/ENDO VII family nuclease [Mycolicibacterium sp. A43C]
MSAPAPTPLPSRSEIEAWTTTHLADAATAWRGAVATSEDAFDQHRQNILAPGGTSWEGDAKDAALHRITRDIGVVGRQNEVLLQAADTAENAVTDINAARREAIAAITAAENDDFTVREDLSVTDNRAYDEKTAAARMTAAAEHAEDIRWTAERLVQADSLAGSQLQAKAAELEGIAFDGEGTAGGAPTVQMVDNKTETNASGEPAKSWEDMMMPPEVGGHAAPEDAPTSNSVAADDTVKNALDETLVPHKTADPDQPNDLNHALDQVAGQPVPPAQGPRLDPAKVEEFKATARKLMQQDGVPANQIEQRLNDMVANAQKPLVPYAPAEGPPPPKPGFGEGFGDAWRSAEDFAHDLTGQNGWDSFKDGWKDLGTGLVETVKDPYGTAARSFIEDAQALRNNPEYFLGGKTFELGAAAATLPFGGEGAAAARLGALDDVARAGIPHDVIDTPRAVHNPAPLTTTDHPSAPPSSADAPSLAGGDHGSPPAGPLGPHGEPGSFGYDADGNRLPYANGGRPPFGLTQVEDTWNLSRQEQLADIAAGTRDLPLPGPAQQWVELHPNGPVGEDWTVENGHRLIEWQPGDPRRGLWDMGHIPGEEYRNLKQNYLEGNITYEQFIEIYRDPENYRVQDPYRNRSHIDEGP